MASDNPTGGDDQQETQRWDVEPRLCPDWVCGFVDGEGCFSVAFHKNPYARQTRGWQIYPSFHVAQHRDNRATLEALASFFGTGVVRSKGTKNSVDVYSVLGIERLAEHVLPVFERHRLRVKARDYNLFREIVLGLRVKEHLEPEGFERIARAAYRMNGRGKQRARTLEDILRGSSETVREAPAPYVAGLVMRQSEPHGDMRSQAEMTWPLP